LKIQQILQTTQTTYYITPFINTQVSTSLLFI